ncbi:16S rRNA (guanine(527)-N(7))-methyltransferase RsmG [Thorsellia kenyensis]|uniref:Ribosomal RNA small subunit methyltransferase G n=1 Tax=Thorsellia kenyensis TaxID=1549888 RepID=A0ABV6CCE6_9GAMM
MQEKLKTLINEARIEATDSQINLWIEYVQLLDKWNKAYNLTSVRNPLDMLNKHILDSLLVTPFLKGNKIIDVGTGPGLPGIVLAIFFPEKNFVLLDSLGKRIRFLKEVILKLELNNVEIVQSRVEEFRPNELFDSVISRAFASLKDMITLCSHLLDENGTYYAMKGLYPEDEIEAIFALGFHDLITKDLTFSASDVKRHLVMIKK